MRGAREGGQTAKEGERLVNTDELMLHSCVRNNIYSSLFCLLAHDGSQELCTHRLSSF